MSEANIELKANFLAYAIKEFDSAKEHNDVVEFNFPVDKVTYKCVAYFVDGAIVFHIDTGLVVPRDKQVTIALLLNAANARMPYGSFEFARESGSLVHRINYFPAETNEVHHHSIEKIFGWVFYNIRIYRSPIDSVVGGYGDLFDTIDKINGVVKSEDKSED